MIPIIGLLDARNQWIWACVSWWWLTALLHSGGGLSLPLANAFRDRKPTASRKSRGAAGAEEQGGAAAGVEEQQADRADLLDLHLFQPGQAKSCEL